MRVSVTGIEEEEAASILLNLRIRWPELQRVCLDEAKTGTNRALDLILVGGASLSLREQVRGIRAAWDGVLIALSAHPSDQELVAVLDGGADDYLALTAVGPQIVARVAAAMRRAPSSDTEWVQYDVLRVNPESREAFIEERRLHLTPTEFRVLLHLARNGGRVLTHEALQSLVWGSEGPFYRGSLHTYVHRLRLKLQSGDGSPIRIMTETRIGYRLVASLQDPDF